MKITNFRPLHIRLSIEYASVDVTTGVLWWKRTESKVICKNVGGLFWFFMDTYQPTPDGVVEELEKGWRGLYL